MEEKQEILRKELEKQRDALVSEINNLELQLKNKRDYLMKLFGGLEAIELLHGPAPTTNTEEENPEEQETIEE